MGSTHLNVSSVRVSITITIYNSASERNTSCTLVFVLVLTTSPGDTAWWKRSYLVGPVW